MSFKSQLEQGLEQIQQMQELYRQVRDSEILPLSFFSAAYDTLKSLTMSLHEMESAQLNAMKEQSSKHESLFAGINTLLRKPEPEMNLDEFVKVETPEEHPEPEIPEQQECEVIISNIPLNDVLNKQLAIDLRNIISLNDHFRFQRELFGGNNNLMNDTLDRLNSLGSIKDAFSYLNNTFEWNWEEEPASDFKIILEKRFF